MELNKNCVVNGSIYYPSVIVSKGPVDVVRITSVEVDEHGVLHVTFDGDVTEKNKGDVFGLYVYCPELRICRSLQPVLRHAGVVAEQLPAEFAEHNLHLYGLVQDEKGRTSDTIYVQK